MPARKTRPLEARAHEMRPPSEMRTPLNLREVFAIQSSLLAPLLNGVGTGSVTPLGVLIHFVPSLGQDCPIRLPNSPKRIYGVYVQ
jgi:hypothetical protein